MIETAKLQEEAVTAERLLIYQTVAARRLAIDSLVWQAPGLALAAQAFLMTIGLDRDAGRLAHVAAGFLSAFVSLMAAQLILRHRRSEKADSLWLERFERDAGWEPIHARLEQRLTEVRVKNSGLARLRATSVWMTGLTAFGIVGLAVGIRALCG